MKNKGHTVQLAQNLIPVMLVLLFVSVLLFPWQLKFDAPTPDIIYRSLLHLGWMLCLVWLMRNIWKQKRRFRLLMMPMGALAILVKLWMFFCISRVDSPVQYRYCILREYPDAPHHAIEMIHEHGFLSNRNHVYEIYLVPSCHLRLVRQLQFTVKSERLVLMSYPFRGEVVDCLNSSY